ncbi:hypothetical protein A7K93_06490 [Candidatus Methylacidiphilum fumarolicum]|uniref:Uncharacterized protein n=1 Tax=Candidatus Methylacidiphilum fumarolicum TaxID=591154 RepID=A0ABN8XDA7_9BACT|nr:hypothetical protein A7K73_07640 [Candidatus Methylacidiphilum fumarolicum]TFE73222.1 hypothetical protein A7K93_06490 [Candidatus Methylacidiphilum fumarolicum]TFE73249.1 hypothetical protein A7K72_06915 [Candidatus Methylacidiphilum fumarolicum]TFE76493.1 hypothetical protein A7D33_09860 [Candidatus Methylacidiphilum fumarolicum]CAI9084479.1 protein of unknown function [Candidatus Methylacidiphilum fumarolicum]
MCRSGGLSFDFVIDQVETKKIENSQVISIPFGSPSQNKTCALAPLPADECSGAGSKHWSCKREG